jgi:hypothetical protein
VRGDCDYFEIPAPHFTECTRKASKMEIQLPVFAIDASPFQTVCSNTNLLIM